MDRRAHAFQHELFGASLMIPETLIARCIREEAKAQYELYRLLHAPLLRICCRYERNQQDAVACLNHGFLKILTRLKDKRQDVPFEPWARRIMINTVIDTYRRNKERLAMETMETPNEVALGPNENEYLKQMESEAFAELLNKLPEMSRKVFNLFVVDGFSHAEIADMLGISAGTSKWHVSTARQLLRSAIGRLANTSTIRSAYP